MPGIVGRDVELAQIVRIRLLAAELGRPTPVATLMSSIWTYSVRPR